MNDQENRQLVPVLFPRNEEEQAALSAAFTQAYRAFVSDNRVNKFKTPGDDYIALKEGPLLNVVRSSSVPDPEKSREASESRMVINDKDRVRGFPYANFSIWQSQEEGKETLLIDNGEDVVFGNDVLEHKALKRLKPYFSSTLNQIALNGCLMHYLSAALSFYLPNTSWINVLGGNPSYGQKTGLEILCSGENQFQLTFTQLGFAKNESKEYSDTTFSFTLNLTFGSAEEEMPSEVTLSKVKLTPFSHELSKAIDAAKELQRKLNDVSFIAKKSNDPVYCYLIATLIFIEKINLNEVLRIAKPQQKIYLLKSIFGRQEFSDWFSQLSESAQDNLLANARALPLSEKIKFLDLRSNNTKANEAFAKDIGWNATTKNINGVSAEELRKIVLLDQDPHYAILKKIIDDAQRPIESYNFFERRFPGLFRRKRTINEDIAKKKYALHLLLSIIPSQNNASEQAFAYITEKDNLKPLVEALLSNLTLLQKLKRYQLANDPLKSKLAEPIKDSEEMGTSSVSDLLRAGATEAELIIFAKFKSAESPAVKLNETTEAIIKGASAKTKPLNFFERNFSRIFKHKARENREIEVQQRALSALVSSDESLADEIQGKIYSKNTPWGERFLLVDILSKSNAEQLKSQAEIFFHQVLPEQEFIANAETFAKLTKILPIGIQDMSVNDIKEGNTTSKIRDFFLGQYIFLCLPLNTLPKQEDFENDAAIKGCCEMITKRTQQIKELLETLTLGAKLENSTPTVKQKTFDSALQNEVQRSALAELALFPNDPYGARRYIEEKSKPTLGTRFLRKVLGWAGYDQEGIKLTNLAQNTLKASVPMLSAFEKQAMPDRGEEEMQTAVSAPIALQRSPSASKIAAATVRTSQEASPRHTEVEGVLQATPTKIPAVTTSEGEDESTSSESSPRVDAHHTVVKRTPGSLPALTASSGSDEKVQTDPLGPKGKEDMWEGAKSAKKRPTAKSKLLDKFNDSSSTQVENVIATPTPAVLVGTPGYGHK